jgi:hypothetical protein
VAAAGVGSGGGNAEGIGAAVEDDAVLGLRWGQPAELKNSFRANFGVCLRRCLFAAELSASCSFGCVTAARIVRRFTPEAIFRALWTRNCTGKRCICTHTRAGKLVETLRSAITLRRHRR